MDFQRLALSFWELTGELSALRIQIDDATQEIEAAIARIKALPPQEKATQSDELTRLYCLKSNLAMTRLALSYFRPLCHARIDECAPGIFERMARELTGEFRRREARPEVGE